MPIRMPFALPGRPATVAEEKPEPSDARTPPVVDMSPDHRYGEYIVKVNQWLSDIPATDMRGIDRIELVPDARAYPVPGVAAAPGFYVPDPRKRGTIVLNIEACWEQTRGRLDELSAQNRRTALAMRLQPKQELMEAQLRQTLYFNVGVHVVKVVRPMHGSNAEMQARALAYKDSRMTNEVGRQAQRMLYPLIFIPAAVWIWIILLFFGHPPARALATLILEAVVGLGVLGGYGATYYAFRRTLPWAIQALLPTTSASWGFVGVFVALLWAGNIFILDNVLAIVGYVLVVAVAGLYCFLVYNSRKQFSASEGVYVAEAARLARAREKASA